LCTIKARIPLDTKERINKATNPHAEAKINIRDSKFRRAKFVLFHIYFHVPKRKVKNKETKVYLEAGNFGTKASILLDPNFSCPSSIQYLGKLSIKGCVVQSPPLFNNNLLDQYFPCIFH
jgi:hypothetical protein